MTTMTVIRGSKWFYRRARLCDVLEVESRVQRWHLWDADFVYVGNYATKTEMLTAAQEMCR